MKSIAVISGGTATNEIVSVFQNLQAHTAYILPILDNGGSTSELIRVIGGPAIGDIRSRLTRLIDTSTTTQRLLRDLLSFRLPRDPDNAKFQWLQIVDGSHPLWSGISPATKEIFRSFFIHVHTELLKRTRSNSALLAPGSSRHFRYQLANVGNMFLTGVRLFTGSLESAIELWSRLTGIDPNTQVLPCLNTNFTYHISALLQDGSIITGQSQISHPSDKQHKVDHSMPSEHLQGTISVVSAPHIDFIVPDHYLSEHNSHVDSPRPQSSDSDSDYEELGNIPQYTHRALRKSQLHFNKGNIEPLSSPVDRIFYVSPYGQEVCPTASSKVLSTITNCSAVVYSVGSLMTSIVPVIVLKGMGKAIASDPNRKKILMVNGCADRETFGMTALDYVRIIVELATYSLDLGAQVSGREWINYVTHIIYMNDPKVPVDVSALLEMHGVKCVCVSRHGQSDTFDPVDLTEKLSMILNEE